MLNKQLKRVTILSVLWKFFERTGVQGVQFAFQIFLARVLTPTDFGTIAIVLVFINLANVVIQNGFSAALIQKKNSDSLDFSSVFYLSMILSILLYCILYYFSPSVASYYNQPQISPLLRIMGLSLFFSSYNSIQNSYIAKNFLFKHLFVCSTLSMLTSSAVSLGLAYFKYGVWSLVSYHLVNQIMITLILSLVIKWKPEFVFSITRIRMLFSYGWKLMIATLLDTGYRSLINLIVGGVFSTEVLGFYNRGEAIPSLLTGSIVGSIQAVLFPVLSLRQDDTEQVKRLVRRAMITSAYVIFPMMIGLASISKPLILLLLTEKWLPAVPFMQILCLSYALWPIHVTNLQAINALGRSDVFLKLEIIKKLMSIGLVFATIRYGVYVMALGGLLSGFLASCINAFPNKKLLKYSYFEQMMDLLPTFIISVIMGVAVHCVNYFDMGVTLTLVTQIFTGIATYLMFSVLFKNESLIYLKNLFVDLRS